MKVVLQRVSSARVTVGARTVGQIRAGYVLLVGFTEGDGPDEVCWMADKLLSLRIFADANGKMNLDLSETGGDILVVSQFTLYGNVRKGRRPSFVDAARPEVAEPLYRSFVDALRARSVGRVETGEFGALMHVTLVNDGPVTLVLERP